MAQAVKAVTAPGRTLAFPPRVCFRVLAEHEKEAALADTVHNLGTQRTFVCDPKAFKKVPGAPFAYWIGERVRDLFQDLAACRI